MFYGLAIAQIVVILLLRKAISKAVIDLTSTWSAALLCILWGLLNAGSAYAIVITQKPNEIERLAFVFVVVPWVIAPDIRLGKGERPPRPQLRRMVFNKGLAWLTHGVVLVPLLYRR